MACGWFYAGDLEAIRGLGKRGGWWFGVASCLVGLVACGGVTSGKDGAQDGAAGAPPLVGNGGGSSSEGPLVPLITGRVSSFEFLPIDPSLPMIETCEAPRTAVGEPLVVDGRTGVSYATFCGERPFLLVGSGDQLTAFELVDGHTRNSYQYIHSPVAEGETWQSGTGELFTWRAAGSLITPVATFESCWSRDAGDDQFFYCRGAGLVRAIDFERNYQLELVEKNF